MNGEEAIRILEGQFDKSCGNYRYQNAQKLDFEDALWMAISALRAQQQAEDNSPLTLDELRKMDGELVWFVREECGRWRILDVICGAACEEFILFDDELSDWMADYGKTWLAYRHKPEAHTATCTATNQPCAMCQLGPCDHRKEAHHGSN